MLSLMLELPRKDRTETQYHTDADRELQVLGPSLSSAYKVDLGQVTSLPALCIWENDGFYQSEIMGPDAWGASTAGNEWGDMAQRTTVQFKNHPHSADTPVSPRIGPSERWRCSRLACTLPSSSLQSATNTWQCDLWAGLWCGLSRAQSGTTELCQALQPARQYAYWVLGARPGILPLIQKRPEADMVRIAQTSPVVSKITGHQQWTPVWHGF